MDPQWFVLAALCLAAWVFAKAFDKLLEMLKSIGALLARIDSRLEEQNNSNDLGTRIDEVAFELYVLRRIAEEQTGIDKEAVNEADQKKRDATVNRLREMIQRRDVDGAS